MFPVCGIFVVVFILAIFVVIVFVVFIVITKRQKITQTLQLMDSTNQEAGCGKTLKTEMTTLCSTNSYDSYEMCLDFRFLVLPVLCLVCILAV